MIAQIAHARIRRSAEALRRAAKATRSARELDVVDAVGARPGFGVEDRGENGTPHSRRRVSGSEGGRMSAQRTLSRRGFIGAGAGLAAAAALGTSARPALGTQDSSTAKAPPGDPPLLPADRIGIQLYSVRDQISSIGFARVFETLAKLGYKQVEFAG
jgi:hypothetical protein